MLTLQNSCILSINLASSKGCFIHETKQSCSSYALHIRTWLANFHQSSHSGSKATVKNDWVSRAQDNIILGIGGLIFDVGREVFLISSLHACVSCTFSWTVSHMQNAVNPWPSQIHWQKIKSFLVVYSPKCYKGYRNLAKWSGFVSQGFWDFEPTTARCEGIAFKISRRKRPSKRQCLCKNGNVWFFRFHWLKDETWHFKPRRVHRGPSRPSPPHGAKPSQPRAAWPLRFGCCELLRAVG